MTGGVSGTAGGVVIAQTARRFDVVVCDRMIANDLTARAAHGARPAFAAGDLADLSDHPRFVDTIFEAFGRIDCLVNDAGVSVKSRGDLPDVSVESYDLNFAVNTRGAFFLTQAVCRRMLATAGDFVESARSVVFVSSSNAAIAAPERGEYAISKASVAMMAKRYAIRLAPHSTAIHEVRPGLISTPTTRVAQARFDKLLEDGFTPINRRGTPEDVGRGVATMAAGDLPSTTGAAIQVDGGMHIHQY